MKFKRIFFIYIVLFLAGSIQIINSTTIDRSLTLNFTNDNFLRTDRSYTAGTKLSWVLSGKGKLSKSSLLKLLPFRRDTSFTDRIVLSIGTAMFTPDDITITSLILEDRPYAGYNYFNVAFIGRTSNVFESFEFSLGLTGPLTLADHVQEIVHEIVGSKKPQGWDNQLENEFIFQLYYDRIWKQSSGGLTKGLKHEIMPRMSAGLGNGLIYMNLGIFTRAGWNLPDDFGMPLSRPGGLRGVIPVNRSRGGFYGFASLYTNFLVRNIFLDGNTFAESHSVDKYMFTVDFNWGIVARFSKFQFTATHALWTKQYILESFNHQFIRLSLSYLY